MITTRITKPQLRSHRWYTAGQIMHCRRVLRMSASAADGAFLNHGFGTTAGGVSGASPVTAASCRCAAGWALQREGYLISAAPSAQPVRNRRADRGDCGCRGSRRVVSGELG